MRVVGNIFSSVVSVPGLPGEKTDPDDHVDGCTAIGVGQADRVVPTVVVVVAAVLGGVAGEEAAEGRSYQRWPRSWRPFASVW
jgi:hypothetical protein